MMKFIDDGDNDPHDRLQLMLEDALPEETAEQVATNEVCLP
jgi:hypothetical protein